MDEQGGAVDEQEAQWRLDWQRRRLSIGKVAVVAVAPARAPIFPAARQLSRPRANLPAPPPAGDRATISARLRAHFARLRARLSAASD